MCRTVIVVSGSHADASQHLERVKDAGLVDGRVEGMREIAMAVLARHMLNHGSMRLAHRGHLNEKVVLAMAFFAVLPACGNTSDSDSKTPVGDSSANDVGQGDGTAPGIDAAEGDGGAMGPTPNAIPLGTYDGCSFSTIVQTPGAGGESGPGGVVTVTQSGSTLSVGYGGDGGYLDAALAFTPTSATSATLTAGQNLDGIGVVCAPLETAPDVTRLAAGSLTYNGGTLFLSVVGSAEPLDAGGGCTNPGGPTAFVVMCLGNAAPGGSDAGAGAGALASNFVGTYACQSSVGEYGPGIQAVSSGSGTLTVTQTGGVIAAAYTNDMFVSGSLQFVPVSASAAAPALSNETMQVTCESVTLGPPLAMSLLSLPVAASTLAIDGTRVFLAFTTGNGCDSAPLTVSLVCDPAAHVDAGLTDAGGSDAN